MMNMKQFVLKVIINILFVLINTLASRNVTSSVKIQGALQQFKILQSFECGHPVYYKVLSCVCDCYKRRPMREPLERLSNYTELCTGNHLCFTVPGKHLFINENQCPAYGICLLRFSPGHIYQHVLLDNFKTFNILKLNENGNILLPTKYASLVDNNKKFKINCMNKTDYPRANQPGWYFWLKDQRRTLFRTKHAQTFNTAKAVNVEKYCWYQVGNKEAIKNKIVALDPLTNETCNGNEYRLNFRSSIGLHQQRYTPDDSDILPGIEVEARNVKFSDQVVELNYFCEMMSLEYESSFNPWFEGVYRKDEEVYLKTNLNFTTGRTDASIAIWDQSGHEVTQEITIAVRSVVVLPLHKSFSNFVGNNVLVCIYVNQSSNWCEHLVIKNYSESELQENHDSFFSTLPQPASTQTIVTLKERKTTENASDSDLSNSTVYFCLDKNENSYCTKELIIVVSVFFVLLVFAFITLIYIKRYGCKCTKNLRNHREEMKDLSEGEALNRTNADKSLTSSPKSP